MKRGRRLSVIVPMRDYEVLETLAERNRMTVSEVVREALRIGAWYQREIKPHPDWKLLVDREGDIAELRWLG